VKDPLAIYLHDHLAGAKCALDLLESLRDTYRGQELGDAAQRLHGEISADKEVLHLLASQFGPTSDVLKDTAAWLAEKVSRVKLAHGDPTGLGLFEALEFLLLGIYGKAALWRTLIEVAHRYDGFADISLTRLLKRAEEQAQLVEKYRLSAARGTFVGSHSSVRE
jgi:hypothetical protein